MRTRIIFNGQEFASTEDMPEEVRRAYQQSLAQFADADQNGIPDILERGIGGSVIVTHHSSITVNGRTYNDVGDLPAAVRRLYEQAMAQVDENRDGLPDALDATVPERETPPPSAGTAGQLDHLLGNFLRVLLGIVAVAILAGAVLIIVTMDAGSRSQGGRWYVAVVALVVLGAVDSQFARLVRRRETFNLTESPDSRRYRILSLLFLLASAVVLLGLALLLP